MICCIDLSVVATVNHNMRPIWALKALQRVQYSYTEAADDDGCECCVYMAGNMSTLLFNGSLKPSLCLVITVFGASGGLNNQILSLSGGIYQREESRQLSYSDSEDDSKALEP